LKLADARGAYDSFSSKLSEVTRQLNLAGIAVIWIFKVGNESGGIAYTKSLLWPLGLFVGSLGLEILHYLYASLAWSILHRIKERAGVTNEQVFKAPAAINWPSVFLFYGKVTLTIIGFALLITYIAKQLSTPTA
jgi:hypothetical protein